jgi:hypothetical protein
MSSTTPACSCPDPELCKKLKRHIVGRLWEIWHGIDIDPALAEDYRRRWLAEAGVVEPPRCPHLWKRVRNPDGTVKRVRLGKG